jgi:hypothetical protein
MRKNPVPRLPTILPAVDQKKIDPDTAQRSFDSVAGNRFEVLSRRKCETLRFREIHNAFGKRMLGALFKAGCNPQYFLIG